MQQLIIRLLETYQSAAGAFKPASDEMEFLNKSLEFARREPACWQRSTLEGHFTASAFVLDAAGTHALLIHHHKLQRWLQPGGHIDDTDADPIDAACREVAEECGLEQLIVLQEGLFDLDVHPIPARGAEPEHLHYDLRFLLQAAPGAILRAQEGEVNALNWVALDALLSENTPRSIGRMAEKVLLQTRV